MNLRPHHLLCIQKFTGHGYDENFTIHMTKIVSKLRDDPETEITVTRGCDDLCKVCPNNIGGVCTSLEKVTFMDGAVLDVCGLSYGDAVPWAVSSRAVRENIFETDKFNDICADCEWFELCKNTEVPHE